MYVVTTFCFVAGTRVRRTALTVPSDMLPSSGPRTMSTDNSTLSLVQQATLISTPLWCRNFNALLPELQHYCCCCCWWWWLITLLAFVSSSCYA